MGQLNYSPTEVTMRLTNRQNGIYNEALPFEIIILISEELMAMGGTSALAALSLLGTRYANAIQQRLFRHIDIRTYDRYARLMRTLQSGSGNPERYHTLASMVRCLSVVLNPYSLQGRPPLHPFHIFNLYDNLPMLEFVDLTEVPMGGLGRSLVPAEEDIDILGTLNRPRSVALTGYLGCVGGSMLIGLPCLEELYLFGDIPVSLFSNAYPRSGRSLRRLTWGTAIPPTLQWIRWVFGESEEEVTDGELVLLVPPNSEPELDAIRQYALRRGMVVRVGSSIAGG
ncbi:unnamed protein product [Rhizoctonia solani]|uniref:Uncharacterized protein n=1 Tax=Rhizoctonia solani TaxID=456999 RepID=A0A8H3D560_9AGAM|nr:unnamed protein product [Rhizoctonia solani]